MWKKNRFFESKKVDDPLKGVYTLRGQKNTVFLRIFFEGCFIHLLRNVLAFKRHIFKEVTVIFSCQNIEK